MGSLDEQLPRADASLGSRGASLAARTCARSVHLGRSNHRRPLCSLPAACHVLPSMFCTIYPGRAVLKREHE